MSDIQCNLVELVKQGDEHAFEQLYQEFYKLAYYFAYKLCRNEADAKDAVQDTFIEIHRSISTLKENSYFKAWMYKIVHSKCKKIFRKNKYTTTDFEEEPIIGMMKEDRMEYTPDYFARFHSDKEVLQACIDQLPLSQKEIIILFYMEQMSIKEISGILDIPVGTVKSRLSYGRNYLKKTLEAYQEEQDEMITFHALDGMLIALFIEELAKGNGVIPPFTMKQGRNYSPDMKQKIAIVAISIAILCGGLLTMDKNTKPANEEDISRNRFEPVMMKNENITTAQDAYFTLIAWACCEDMLNEKSMEEILQAQPLYHELKEHGGAYYEQLVKQNWATAYEKRLLDK